MRRAPGIAQRLPERFERVQVVVITAHILEQGNQVLEGAPVIDLAGLLDTVRHLFAHLRQVPLRGGDAYHRHVEGAALGHRVERRKDHFVGEVASHAEDHQRISWRRATIGIIHFRGPLSSHHGQKPVGIVGIAIVLALTEFDPVVDPL